MVKAGVNSKNGSLYKHQVSLANWLSITALCSEPSYLETGGSLEVLLLEILIIPRAPSLI